MRVHGGSDNFGVSLYDFSTNSNAYGPCPITVENIRAVDFHHYPDPSYTSLKNKLANFHNVSSSRILIAGSASEFIFRITSFVKTTQKHASVFIPTYAYGDYQEAAKCLNISRASQLEHANFIWLCEPSSPLGQNISTSLITNIPSSSICVLDRAYEPLRLSTSFSSFSKSTIDKLWQIWTPNKALGITGVRGAYIIAPLNAEETTKQLNNFSPSWVMGSHGIAMLESWVKKDVQDWLQKSLHVLDQWKKRQIELCLSALKWNILPSEANFFYTIPDEKNLPIKIHKLRQNGIKLRETTSFGLPNGLRLSVLRPIAQDILVTNWKESRI